MSAVFPVDEDVRWRRHTATAGQTVFPIPYVFQANADISIVKTGLDGAASALQLGVHYTMTGAGNPAGGSYTLVTPAIEGEKYLSAGDAVMTRTTSIVRSGKYASEATDQDLDRALIRDLEQRRDIDRAVKADFGSTGGLIAALPDGHFWKAQGNNMVDGGSAADIINAQAYAGQVAADKDIVLAAKEAVLNAVPALFVPTRAALKAVNPTIFTHVFFSNSMWEFRTGDYSAKVTSDPVGGFYVASNANPSGSAGCWVRMTNETPLPEWFDAVGDGRWGLSCTILVGSKNIATCPAESFTGAEVGRLFKVGNAGSGGATHISLIAEVLSSTQIRLVTPAVLAVAGKPYSYASDDLAALVAARNFCWANGDIPLNLKGGTRYGQSDNIEWARSHWSLIPLGMDTWFDSFATASGKPFSINGTTQDDTYGIYEFNYGGEFGIGIDGNSHAQAVAYYNSCFWGKLNVRLRNGNIGLLGDNVGAQLPGPQAACVDMDIEVRVAHHDRGPFHVVPAVGYYMSYSYAMRVKPQLEVSVLGLYAAYSNRVKLDGGTIESNGGGGGGGGAQITSTCAFWQIHGTHNEFNNAFDWDISGPGHSMHDMASVDLDLAKPNVIIRAAADRVSIYDSDIEDITVESGAAYTLLQGGQVTGALGDSSATMTVRRVKNLIDKAPPPVMSAPTLGSGVTNGGGGAYYAAGYFLTDNGFVGIRGTVAIGTYSGSKVLATIAYLPAKAINYLGTNLDTRTAVSLQINTSGQVLLLTTALDNAVIDITSPLFELS